jgi:predicted outer membrane lipoprotein
MSAAAVSAPAAVASRRLLVQRDDGLLAGALARLGPPLPVAPAALVVFGALPMFALIAAHGDGAAHAGAGVALGWLVLLGGLAAGRPHTDRMRWAVPPALRAGEYAAILWLGALGDALPAAFAILAVLWFRHYELVYRLRHQGVAPPGWVGALTGGWEGRLLGGWLLLVAGALPTAFYLYAAALALVLVGETVAAWRRFSHPRPVVGYEAAEDEEE